jgi:serine protease
MHLDVAGAATGGNAETNGVSHVYKRLTLLFSLLTLAGIFATAPMAAASQTPRTAPAVHHATVINLHRAFEARLGHTKPGKVAGIVYARGKQPKAHVQGPQACSEPDCPLAYQGGLIQQNPQVYLLLWGQHWTSDPNQAASAAYLENFYNGLGMQPQDHWSTTTSQYGDSSGVPTFSGSVYMGAWLDNSTPPTGATQSQLAAEADAFASSQGIGDLNDTQIVVATQSGTCPQGFYAPSCAGGSGDYCAWHSSSNEPFTNLPYILDAGANCGEDYVNPNGTHDGFSIVGGHEYAETITDPYPDSGWIDLNDPAGGEVGDKCAWTTPNGDVTLATGSFAMQSLWSNAAKACVMATQPNTNPLSVSKSGTGSGTVTSVPAGIHCGAVCTASFPAGTSVTLTAKPAAGTTFTGWNGACVGMAHKTCTVTMNGSQTVSASFTGSSHLYQETSATYQGNWIVSKCSCYSGGTDKYSTVKGAFATFTFTGKLIQFVSEQSAARGSFKVYIDGVLKGTVSNYSTVPHNAVVVWQHSFTKSGKHTLKIVNVGTSGHNRIDADAFVVGT